MFSVRVLLLLLVGETGPEGSPLRKPVAHQHRPVAQLEEHTSDMREVSGSIPLRPTTFLKVLPFLLRKDERRP